MTYTRNSPILTTTPTPTICGRCRDCKWWGEPIAYTEGLAGEDSWVEFADCNVPIGAILSVVSEPTADFGCVAWEAKE